jgi:hypothetical protein
MTFCGGPGVATTTTAFDAADGALVPASFVAVTVHVYVAPVVTGVTGIGLDAPLPEPGSPPFDDRQVASNVLTAAPPSLTGVNVTKMVLLPSVATPIVGGSGAVTVGVAGFDAAEALLVPTAFVAVTEHV